MSWTPRITENLGIKIIALLLAGLLYAHVVTDRPVEQVITLPVQIVGLGDSLALASAPPEMLGVRVRGTGKQMIRLRVLQPPVAIDLAGVGPGNYQRALTSADFQPVSQEKVEVLAAVDPPTVNLIIEERANEQVPVSVRLNGEPPPGFVISGEPDIRPQKVRLSGPLSWVEEQEGIETVGLDISGQRNLMEAMVALVAPPPWARVVPGSVLVSIQIEEELRGEKSLEPVIEGLRGASFTARVDPPLVTVSWAAPRSLAREATEDLQVKIDVGRRGRGRFVLPVEIIGEGTSYVVSVEPESVAVTLH